MRKSIKIALISLAAVLMVLLGTLPLMGRNYVPRIINGEGLSKDAADEIISVEQGYYNSNLPFFVTSIKIIENTGDYILYRVYYFPFVSIERSCTREPNGNWIFNLEKPLF